MDDALIPDRLLRALRYIDLVDSGGGQLSDRDIDAYVATPPPASEISMNFQTSLLWQLATLANNGTAAYMKAVGWISAEQQTPRLTSAGRAIVKATSSPSDDAVEGGTVTVLSPEDPLNLVSLTGAVAEARAGLLADPYFVDQHLRWVMEATSISRLLLCRKKGDRSLLELAAGAAAQESRDLEIRCLNPTAFHDRYLLDEDGSVSMIGASLNGLHKHFTVIVPVPEPGSTAVREHLEEKWELAERIEPRATLAAPDA